MLGVAVGEGIRVAVAEGAIVAVLVGRTDVRVADGVVTGNASGACGAQDAEKNTNINKKKSDFFILCRSQERDYTLRFLYSVLMFSKTHAELIQTP